MYCGSINRSGQSLQKALAHILVVITDDIDHRIRFDPLGVGLLLDQMRLQHPLAGIVVALVEAVGRQITDPHRRNNCCVLLVSPVDKVKVLNMVKLV